MILLDDFLGKGKDLSSGFGVKRCRMLVEQEHLRLVEGGHEQGERLALTTREQADLGGETRVEAQIELLEELGILGLFRFGNAPGETPALAAATCERQVLDNLHIGSRSAHRVLEHATQVLCALRLGKARDVDAIELDHAGIERIDTGNHVEQG